MDKKPFKILGIEHIGVAKKSLDGINNIFYEILGIDYSSSEIIEDQNVKTDIYNTGAGKIEFLKGINNTSPINSFINNTIYTPKNIFR